MSDMVVLIQENQTQVEILEDQTIIKVYEENSSVTIADVVLIDTIPAEISGVNFTQNLASSTWVIAHNLGYKPIVEVFSVGGVQMIGTVVHISHNLVNVQFEVAVAGFARLI